MKKFLFICLFIPSIAYAQLPLCDNHARVTSVNIDLASGSGNTQIIAATSGQVIYVCGYVLIAGAATNVTFLYGTGTNCGTGTTTLETLEFSTNAGFGIAIPNTGSVQTKTALGSALCLGRSAASTLRGRITYVVQ